MTDTIRDKATLKSYFETDDVPTESQFSDFIESTQLYQTAPYALTDGASIAVDLNNGLSYSVTLTDNRTLANPTNLKAGCDFSFIISQDGTGSRTLAYGNLYLFPGGVVPTLTSTASAKDLLTFHCDGTNMILVNVVYAMG